MAEEEIPFEEIAETSPAAVPPDPELAAIYFSQ